ncbi:hypothetical protein B9Q04_13270 [Candidatus Marsarchaeota G2 archaeon BE_D]|jgi:hypothetical protein|uniref:Uncharacterized protein n=1 Tax=Candidatus Marsarchaeota G2 archaeon BE_D TaxID=1978158 RepID=A0A2R6C7Z9_9ARCH|nr:MAG: hypothetical protein B9Q04_13270 [Candidatus Marsarchaeota G2 archaeon BE_D]
MGGDSLAEWSIDGYTVRLIRQDELEGGVVLHFEVEKPVEVKKERLSPIGGLLGRKDKKPNTKPIPTQTRTEAYSSEEYRADGDKDFLVRYSRMDPITSSVVVGLYVHESPDKGTPVDAYNQRMKQIFYEAARIAVEESRKLGLN